MTDVAEKLQEEVKTLKWQEVEVKFRLDEGKLNDWKQLVTSLKEEDGFKFKEFIYVDSDDIYFTRPVSTNIEYEFVRYRFADDKKNKRAELTTKRKLKDGNNIFRMEKNLRVDNNSKELVTGFVEDLGFEFNFRITKYVQIYVFEDATLPFYTVIDGNGKRDTFIEIEVDEAKLHNMTEDQAWDVIKKYEAVLAPLGLTPKNRLRKSLFEMYKKEG
jgi:adenylate cyclase class IV